MTETLIVGFAQIGYSFNQTLWIDNPFTLQPSASYLDCIGLVFDLGVSDTHTKDPTRILLTPGLLAIGNELNVVLDIYVVDETTPANYSDSLIPGLRGEITPRTLVCSATGDVSIGQADWTELVQFGFEIGRRYINHQWQDDVVLRQNWQRFWGQRVTNSAWSGRIAFTHSYRDTVGALAPTYVGALGGVNSPLLEYGQWPAHTGHLNWPLDRGRSVHDGRSGLPAMSLDLVEDGFVPGLWVKPDKRDEEDHSLEAELPDSEGAVTDEIP